MSFDTAVFFLALHGLEVSLPLRLGGLGLLFRHGRVLGILRRGGAASGRVDCALRRLLNHAFLGLVRAGLGEHGGTGGAQRAGHHGNHHIVHCYLLKGPRSNDRTKNNSTGECAQSQPGVDANHLSRAVA